MAAVAYVDPEALPPRCPPANITGGHLGAWRHGGRGALATRTPSLAILGTWVEG